MSIPKEAQVVSAIVMVNLSESDSPAEWVPGVITGISKRPAGAYGDALRVDVRPHRCGETVRYSAASRIQLATESECKAFACARISAGLMGQVQPATPSLSTQSSAGDTRMTNAHEAVQTVALRVTKGGAHVNLKQVSLDAIFTHPQVIEAVNGLFKEGADAIVASNQAMEFKGEALERANKSLAEDLDLSRTSLKSCDTERRALLQSDTQKTGEIARLKEALANAQRAVLAAEKLRTNAPANHLIHIQQAGVGRGFILWNPKSSRPPQQIYDTYAKAVEVQEYMANKNQDEVFHILPIGPGLMYRKPVKATRCVC